MKRKRWSLAVVRGTDKKWKKNNEGNLRCLLPDHSTQAPHGNGTAMAELTQSEGQRPDACHDYIH